MGRISKEQQLWIDSLQCERLSYNENNRNLLLCFSNERGEHIVDHLNNNAWDEDNENTIAHYLIKKDKDILFFFSLKCGELFEDVLCGDFPLICEAYSKEREMTPDIRKLIQQYQYEHSLSDSQLKSFLDEKSIKWRNQRKSAKQADNISELPQVKTVLNTIPAIEIVYFCKNESSQLFNKNLFPNRKIGEIVFGFYILPKIQNILQSVGCKYIYLFAADNDENEPLINYYSQKFKFSRQTEYGANKPSYNCSCKFMCLSLSDAKAYYDELYENFNIDDSVELI